MGIPCTEDVKDLQSLLCPDNCSSSSFSIFGLFWPEFTALPLIVDALLVTETLGEQFVRILELVTTWAFNWGDFGKVEDREPDKDRVKLPLVNAVGGRGFCATTVDGVMLLLHAAFVILWPEGAIINKLFPFLSHTTWDIGCCSCFWLLKLVLYAWFSLVCFSCFKYDVEDFTR